MSTFIVSTYFRSITTVCCGGTFAVPETALKNWENTHNDWTCPFCGTGQYFAGESDKERLKRELESERNCNKVLRDNLEFERRCVAAHKAAKTKLKKRISSGVCPCCDRTFKQLARHMKDKHPDYTEKP